MSNAITSVFLQFRSSSAYKLLIEGAEKIIKQEEEKFWDMEDEEGSKEQRLKVQNIKDFWAQLEVFITNSAIYK